MPSDQLPEHGSRRTAILTAIVGFAVLAAVTLTRARPPGGFEPGGAIGWGTITNRTADPRLGSAARGALDIALGQSGALRLVAGRHPGGRFHLDLIVEPAGGGVRVLAVIRDSAAARADTMAVEEGSLPDAIDGVGGSVRSAFGERRTERDRASVPVARLGSASLDALAAYGDAIVFEAGGADSAAVVAARLAVAADSGFAQAWLVAGLGALALRNQDGAAWIVRGKALLARGPRPATPP